MLVTTDADGGLEQHATTRGRTPTRDAAELTAQALGYRDLDTLLEAAYAQHIPWSQVAKQLGQRCDTVQKWGNKLGCQRAGPLPRGAVAPTKRGRPPAYENIELVLSPAEEEEWRLNRLQERLFRQAD